MSEQMSEPRSQGLLSKVNDALPPVREREVGEADHSIAFCEKVAAFKSIETRAHRPQSSLQHGARRVQVAASASAEVSMIVSRILQTIRSCQRRPDVQGGLGPAPL